MMKNEHNMVIIWAQNKPGVLNKILSLCRRRRYNIESLTAGTTNVPNISHITVVFTGLKEGRIKHIVHQINKIIEVLEVEAVEPKDVVDKELVLLVLRDKGVANKLLKKITHEVNIRVINTVDNKPVLEIVGEGIEVDHVLGELDLKKDVVRMVRSGQLALKI